MPAPEDELHALRRRAYGPAADIHTDPAALQRLTEIEDAAAAARGVDSAPTDPAEDAAEQPTPPTAEPTPPPEDPPTLPRFRVRLRPSTALIMLGVAVLAAAAVVSLTLVQRVQADPLQVGAVQIARLAPDAAYDAPAMMAPDDSVAYADFHGFRTFISSGYMEESDAVCMDVFEPDRLREMDETSFSYDGQYIRQACAAGRFPASTTFAVTSDSPAALREAYPVGTALQFVFDQTNNEVVVFLG